jgi:carboxyl-terminal processing protease
MRCDLSTSISPREWNRFGIRAQVLLLLLGLLALPASLSAQTIVIEELHRQAIDFEQRHDWLEACRVYDEILRKDRAREDIRGAYQRCLRCYHIVHRHQDKVYRQALTRVTPKEALDMYEKVLDTVADYYVDRHKTSLAALFRQGIEELRLALEEAIFQQEYFPGTPREVVEAFKAKLEDWRDRKIVSHSDARSQVVAVGRTAQQMGLGYRPILLTVITLEFLSGACNALDEYTLFLTPGYFKDLQAALRGHLVSIGVDLASVEGYLEITRVYPRSPAMEAGLMRHDRILRIDGQFAATMPAEVAAERLRGKTGSMVELEVYRESNRESMGQSSVLKLTRRTVSVPSVEYELKTVYMDTSDGMKPVSIGKLTIACFQETTLQEVKEALASLQTDGMKALILDLRGNPGGLVESAIQVAELFLPEGIIVVSQTEALNKYLSLKWKGPIKADSMNPLLLPMIVVIDGETASAAEVLAGALKENGRAMLIGQTTFGKGSIQCFISLKKAPFDKVFDKMPGGIRITVAKLLSPSWQPYSGQGVRPNIFHDSEGNTVLTEAQRFLLDLLLKPMKGERPASPGW